VSTLPFGPCFENEFIDTDTLFIVTLVVTVVSSNDIFQCIPFQLYIFAISMYALALTIRQILICTDKEWNGEYRCLVTMN